MKITGAEAIVQCLRAEGVEIIFGYPGGAIMPFYDALYDYQDTLKHVLVRHEQGAIHAAQGYALSKGRAGVCIATSGPGATNLVTGLLDAMMDSVPLVCITGQVPANVIGTDAFQEADVIGITTPITKWNYQITSADEIPEVFAKAFHIANTGRPGPVLIDITKNAQFEHFEFNYPEQVTIDSYNPNTKANPKQLELAAELLNNSVRPYMLIGHGILIAEASKQVIDLVEKTGIPVASTLLGLSAVPVDHPNYVGWLGMHGNYGPNIMTNKADVILAVGMRFDDRVTGNLDDYATNARVIHIDIDPAELNKNVTADVPIVADAKEALTELLPLLKENNHSDWIKEFRDCDKIEADKIIKKETEPESGEIKMAEIVKTLSDKTKGEAVIVADVGQHQMKSARYYRFKHPHSMLTSGGAGTMGYALPAAIGAKFAHGDNREVIAIIGDGSFQMTIQEMITVMQEKLPVKIIVMNNEFLGMVRQWQQLFFDTRYSSVNLDNPDFVKIAEACRIKGKKITKREELSQALDEMLESKESFFLEIKVEQEENVFPMIPSGAGVDDIRLE